MTRPASGGRQAASDHKEDDAQVHRQLRRRLQRRGGRHYTKQDDAAVRSAVAWDERNLYVAWDVTDDTPWLNAATMSAQMYLGGDTVDLQLGTDPAATRIARRPTGRLAAVDRQFPRPAHGRPLSQGVGREAAQGLQFRRREGLSDGLCGGRGFARRQGQGECRKRVRGGSGRAAGDARASSGGRDCPSRRFRRHPRRPRGRGPACGPIGPTSTPALWTMPSSS